MAGKDIKKYQTIALGMMETDKHRDAMFRGMDAMFRGEWKWPGDKPDWVRVSISTDPHDAPRAGARVLSALDPAIRLQPMGDDEGSKEKANRIERVLKWHFFNASRRRRASVVRDVVMSALLYDEVCARITYLPHHEKTLKAFKGESKRLKAARRYGPFAITVVNPQWVHTRYSDFMPEAVLHKSVQSLDEVLDFWGPRANSLKILDKGKEQPKYATVYDYTDLETRVVWAVASEHDTMALPDNSAAKILIPPRDHDLPFLPWVCRVGGTTLQSDSQHQRVPMLYSVFQTGQWEHQNIAESLVLSELIAYAAAPRMLIQGPAPDTVEVDYDEPNRPIEAPPVQAGYNIQQLQPPQINEGLLKIADIQGGKIGKSTVAGILMGGDLPAQTAYQTLNLAVTTALGSLKPYKELAELALGDVLTQMLLWTDHNGDRLVAYERSQDGLGQTYSIEPGDIDPDNIYISVELKPDVPTDRQQRINGAAMARQQLGYSQESSLEDIGVTDPQAEIKKATYERLREFYTQRAMNKLAFQDQMEQQAQQLAMQQQLAGQAAGQPAPGTPPGMPGIGGQGANPAAGGQSPLAMGPATFENQTGMTRNGQPNAQ